MTVVSLSWTRACIARAYQLRRSTADIEALAHALDSRFAIPGLKLRFGYDALLGLIPGVGDALSAVLGGYLLVRAHNLGAPASLLARMGLNLALDAVLGALPIVGDIGDVAFRANTANVRLLLRHLQRSAGPEPTLKPQDRRAPVALEALGGPRIRS